MLEIALRMIEQHIDSNEPLLLFINRNGDLDRVTVSSEKFSDEDDISAVFYELTESATSDRPHFPICTVVNGLIQDNGGQVISLEHLPEAIVEAEQERIRFYSEREAEYGASAWPVGATR